MSTYVLGTITLVLADTPHGCGSSINYSMFNDKYVNLLLLMTFVLFEFKCHSIVTMPTYFTTLFAMHTYSRAEHSHAL